MGTCMLEGCNETARAKGLCTRHYMLIYREMSDISGFHAFICFAAFSLGVGVGILM